MSLKIDLMYCNFNDIILLKMKRFVSKHIFNFIQIESFLPNKINKGKIDN